MDTRTIGVSIIHMKGGRAIPSQKLDLATGYTNFIQVGDYVDETTPLAVVHYQTEEQYHLAKQSLLSAITISEKKPEISSPILSRM